MRIAYGIADRGGEPFLAVGAFWHVGGDVHRAVLVDILPAIGLHADEIIVPRQREKWFVDDLAFALEQIARSHADIVGDGEAKAHR